MHGRLFAAFFSMWGLYARVQESWAKLMTLQILQGGILPWAPAGDGGGKSRRSIAPTPPLKSKKIIALRGGGNSRQLSPLNKIHYLHGRLFAAFSLPFLHVRAFLLRFSHYILRPLRGGGRASLGVRPSLKNEEKNMFCYMRGLLLLFSPCGFFCHVVHILPFCYFFSMLEAFFVFMEEGGACFGLLPPTKTSTFYFCE